MSERFKNVLIGGFVAGTLLITCLLVLFLRPHVGDGKQLLRVRFANVAGITKGTRVSYAGRPVGYIVAIAPTGEGRTDREGPIYAYELTLKVDSSVTVYTTDEIALRTTGLMGEKSISILPKPAAHARPVTNEVLFAQTIDPFEATVNQVGRLAKQADETLRKFDTWFAQNETTLTHTLQSLDGTLTAASSLLFTADKEALVSSLSHTTHLVNENLEAVRSSLVQDNLLGQFSALTAELQNTAQGFNQDGLQTLASLNRISRNIADGTGTVGRFINQDDFYLRLSSLMSKGETLINTVNHHGLLFQYDKHWKKDQVRRANMLRSLETPDEFKAYFENEVDGINTSIGRLTELLERTSTFDERTRLAQTDSFQKDFAALLRMSQSLTDSIRLYNEGLVAQLNETPTE